MKLLDSYVRWTSTKLSWLWMTFTRIYTQIDGIENPRSIGKGLTANLSSLWRYRIDYRVLCRIEDERLVAVIVGHQRNVYDQ